MSKSNSDKLVAVASVLVPVLVDAGMDESDVRLHRRHIDIYRTGLRITIHGALFMLHRRVLVQDALETDSGTIEERFIGSCSVDDIVAAVKLAAITALTRRIDEVIETLAMADPAGAD